MQQTRETRYEPRYEPDRYEQKKFDYRYDDRFYKNPAERREEKREQREEIGWQPAYAPQMQARREEEEHKWGYDAEQPAGRANKYNIKITDLLTSILDPEIKDDRPLRLMEANKGYLVMVRFKAKDLLEVIPAIQKSVGMLTSHEGYCIGFSQPELMKVISPSHQMMAREQWWDPNYQSRFAVCCFWFKDYFQARSWFHTRENRLFQPDFPNSDPYQVIAIPLTYGRNANPIPFTPDQKEITLLWSEYPNIYERFKDDFLYNYSEPTRQIVRAHGGNPYVSVCRYKAGEPPEMNKFGSPGYARFETPVERVGRSWRNCWVAPDTFITVSTFPSMGNVYQFYQDERYNQLKHQLSRYSDPVVVAMTLVQVQGTARR